MMRIAHQSGSENLIGSCIGICTVITVVVVVGRGSTVDDVFFDDVTRIIDQCRKLIG